MKYKLFLDDVRLPKQCQSWMEARIGKTAPIYLEDSWIVVRNKKEFVDIISRIGLPEFVSFDHDLSPSHMKDYLDGRASDDGETGLDCAKWLLDYCLTNKKPLPSFAVHSMNPVGSEAILFTLAKYICENLPANGQNPSRKT